MSLSNNLYDYKYFFTPLGKKDHALPQGIKTIIRILEDQGFIRVRQVKLANTFSIDLYDHHFTAHISVKNFNTYQIYEQIKMDSRNEYVPHHELQKLAQMISSNDIDVAYLGILLLSKLNLVYIEQVAKMKKENHYYTKLVSEIHKKDDPYVIMCWYYYNNKVTV